jgi:hypothetical protein
MALVNITNKAKNVAADAGLYIEASRVHRTLPNGEETATDVIEIGEDSTDYLITYGLDGDGSLFLICKPDYVEDLPAHITNSATFTRVVEYAANFVD